MEKYERVFEQSKKVILDCSLENGSIVAANATKKYYPATAKNYFYVWPRDASYACIASDIIGINDVQENFFNWCLNYAEGFNTTGLFFEKYHPNGLKALLRFQPDQTGIFLFAVWHHLNRNPPKKKESKYLELITKAANGICNVWRKDHFTIITNDLWEERLCFPDLHENFSYSLASCIKGLLCANELLPNKKWSMVAEEMKKRLDEHYQGFFMRSFGKIPDKRIDASILGLVYPFEIYDSNDSRIIASVNEIESRLSGNGGIHRYEQDEYDGWMVEDEHRKKGAGAWPVLNFWLSVYYMKKGDLDKARQYFNWVIDRINADYYIPEQIFENNIQVSVSPLLWSHVMFIIAFNELQQVRKSTNQL
jgi:glucoamylase